MMRLGSQKQCVSMSQPCQPTHPRNDDLVQGERGFGEHPCGTQTKNFGLQVELQQKLAIGWPNARSLCNFCRGAFVNKEKQ